MGESGVRKGYHCAWQIHYHIVFPVKFRKALLDKEIDKIIEETAAKKEIGVRSCSMNLTKIFKDQDTMISVAQSLKEGGKA